MEYYLHLLERGIQRTGMGIDEVLDHWLCKHASKTPLSVI